MAGLLWLISLVSSAQNVAGDWLGVVYLDGPGQIAYNYTLTLTQNGTSVSGTSQTSKPNQPFGSSAFLSGQIMSSQLSFSEADASGNPVGSGVCFWKVNLTYDPAGASLKGTFETINNSGCTQPERGTVELYQVGLTSASRFCKGSPIEAVVTGKNIQWYTSPSRTSPVARGNTFSPAITQTTTYYLTQTLYNTESPAVPITLEVLDAFFTASVTNPGCGQTRGTITLTPMSSTDWRYSLNGVDFQLMPVFSGLNAGNYTITATNATGCRSEQAVTVKAGPGPQITELKQTPPHCGAANGEITVVTSGGQAPLTYSMDNGHTFQRSPTFGKLPGGTYTFRARDANGCETNYAVDLPITSAITLVSASGSPTTCGEANGEVTFATTGGSNPVLYSLDNQTFQPDATFGKLAAGTYTVIAQDRDGCTVSQTIHVAPSVGLTPVTVQTTAEQCGQQNGTIQIIQNSFPDALTFSLDGQTFQRSPTFFRLRAGDYTLVSKDTNHCTVRQAVTVSPDCVNRVHFPTAFSPNADRINDVFTVHFAGPSLTVLQFTVYDRWGAILYNRANFELFNGEPVWDGQISGLPASAGVYGYHLDCQFADGTKASYHDSVALVN
ncbi:hypothetical protein GCM10028773_14500 [Spirosoma koreense]